MVPDTTQVKIDPLTNTLVREGVPFITNPFDDNAVEEALRIKDRFGARVTIVSMGPPTAEPVIRKAIFLGADGGILLSDRAFGGADTLATSIVLSAAISELSKEKKVDLVICGKQTIDGDTAQVGPGIATRLGYGQVTLVDRVVNVDKDASKIVVRRIFEDRHEVVEVKLPALISVMREINRPRYPSVPRRLYAKETQIPVWNNYFLRLDPNLIGLKGSPTQVKRIFAPSRAKGETITGDKEGKGKAIQAVIAKLAEMKIVGS
jgi:electron transfer flavoprotein beta subunit